MKFLQRLEEKVVSLIELIKELKTENAKLIEENAQLEAKLKGLESSLSEDTAHLEELSKEKERTKMVVDELMKSIDSLVEIEQQP